MHKVVKFNSENEPMLNHVIFNLYTKSMHPEKGDNTLYYKLTGELLLSFRSMDLDEDDDGGSIQITSELLKSLELSLITYSQYLLPITHIRDDNKFVVLCGSEYIHANSSIENIFYFISQKIEGNELLLFKNEIINFLFNAYNLNNLNLLDITSAIKHNISEMVHTNIYNTYSEGEIFTSNYDQLTGKINIYKSLDGNSNLDLSGLKTILINILTDYKHNRNIRFTSDGLVIYLTEEKTLGKVSVIELDEFLNNDNMFYDKNDVISSLKQLNDLIYFYQTYLLK